MASWTRASDWPVVAERVTTISSVPRLLTPTGLAPARLRRTRTPRGPYVQALMRTVRNPMGLLGAVLVLLLVCSAIAAPLISPFDPIEQHPGSELRAPGAQFLLGTDNLGRDLLSRII